MSTLAVKQRVAGVISKDMLADIERYLSEKIDLFAEREGVKITSRTTQLWAVGDKVEVQVDAEYENVSWDSA